MEKKLAEMLGNNAFQNDMKVDCDFAKLVKTVNYLSTQLKIIGGYSDDEIKQHINDVLESATEILNKDL